MKNIILYFVYQIMNTFYSRHPWKFCITVYMYTYNTCIL